MPQRLRAFILIGLASCVSLAVAAGRAQAAAETPKQVLQHANERINTLLRKQPPVGTPEEKKNRDEIKKIVNGFLDFDELAKQALGNNWAKRTRNEQAEFVDLLRELIERNYVKQLKGNLDYLIDYSSEDIKGDQATVASVVKSTPKPGTRPFETRIDYKLRKTGAGWMVFDVVTDEVSLVRNYRSQFNRIITKDSYEALVRKMKNKLAEEG